MHGLVMNQGFSLVDVFVSILLVSSLSLLLLKQQWHTSQLFNQTSLQMDALNHLKNAFECRLADEGYEVASPFQLDVKSETLDITWKCPSAVEKELCTLRQDFSSHE
jgi:type II secretory pathway component PulJ